MTVVRGIDISQHQGAIDWSKITGAGDDFALARMTIGRTTIDTLGRRNLAGMLGRVPFAGAYGVVGTTEPVEDGAKRLVDEIAAAGADPGSVLVMLDAEDFADGSHPSIAQVGRYATQLHTDLGRWPTAYVPGWWLDKHGYTVGPALANCPWAQSRYIAQPWSETRLRAFKPTDLRGFSSLAWLQYTSSATVPGISVRVDANVFYGTTAQFKAAFFEEDDMTIDDLRKELTTVSSPSRKAIRELCAMGARDALGATLDDEAKLTALAQQLLSALQADPADRIDTDALGQRVAEILHTLGLPVTIADADIQRNLAAVLERSRLEVGAAS